MPIAVITSPCKTCSTGQPLRDGATFCPNCGRTAAAAAQVPPPTEGSWLAIGIIVAVVTVLVGIGLVGVLLLVRVTHTTRPAVVAVRARPTPAVVAPAVVTPTVITPATADRTPAPSETPVPEPPTADAMPSAPPRAGDTDLAVDPLAAYAGGPPADRLSIRGLRMGLSLADVPPAMLADSAPDHLRDLGGNLYAVDDGHISEVHVRDPDLLARWPIDSVNALTGHFGDPADVYTGDGDEAFPTYLYPARGIHVRWDNAAGRIIELVLVRPTPVGR